MADRAISIPRALGKGVSAIGNIINAAGHSLQAIGNRDKEFLYLAKEDAKDTLKDIVKIADHGVYSITGATRETIGAVLQAK